MAATETLYSRTCLINCRENSCSCVNSNGGVDEIRTNGQNILAFALRALRLSKSNVFAGTDEKVLVEEKCRRIITLNEVSNHDTSDDCWIILYDRVYDVTDFLYEHPGGKDIILEHAGRDASVAFRGHSRLALMSLKQYEIGDLPEKERIYRREGLLRCDELPE